MLIINILYLTKYTKQIEYIFILQYFTTELHGVWHRVTQRLHSVILCEIKLCATLWLISNMCQNYNNNKSEVMFRRYSGMSRESEIGIKLIKETLYPNF